ncbi:uncharacterized protein LOC129575577 isoform X2 [Sitodiplosis mosellana]|uniref:uncharacterized protein LOC129575577 isoform X2 n=1 Tax=Sitodiplosis mosellana TaxID=263140 RepID=UPI00244415EA|nr:uncharacterized protein LOC129575577 isoform X2 [Sitodiplosis mosellana]
MKPAWSRPIDTTNSYPNVWLEFNAKESKNSDRIIKYRIQDLPEDRFDDAIQHIIDDFLLDAPITKFFGAATNKKYVEDYLRSCRWKLPNKTTLVCFREGSDEIVGLNVTYVSVKNDPFWQEAQTDEYKDHMTITRLLRANVDIFEKYKVDKYLGCICLSVAQAYRGLNIGQRLLEAREPLCKALDIRVTQSLFVSDNSNHIADKVGFKIDSQYTMDELSEIYPKIPFKQFDAKIFAVKSWNFQKINA